MHPLQQEAALRGMGNDNNQMGQNQFEMQQQMNMAGQGGPMMQGGMPVTYLFSFYIIFLKGNFFKHRRIIFNNFMGMNLKTGWLHAKRFKKELSHGV